MTTPVITTRRLAVGDEAVLALIAVEDPDFDVAGRAEPMAPPSPDAARAYLSDPSALIWVAEVDGKVVGHMSCNVLRKRDGDVEVLFYEIGVRSAYRRKGVGMALVAAITAWMKAAKMTYLWVLADNADAVKFYAACGFEGVGEGEAVFMIRS